METQTIVKKVKPNQLKQLQTVCKEVYPIYFGDYWLDNGLEIYLEEQFGTARLQADLQSDAFDYFLIYHEEKIAGFLKINYQASINDLSENVADLEKIYLYPDFRGKGVGKATLAQLIELLRAKGKAVLSLDVMETNTSAIAFYEKQSFVYHSSFKLPYENLKPELNSLRLMYLKLE